MMKVKVIFAAILLMAAVGMPSAQNDNQAKNDKPRKTCYVDANNNGVCDNYENGNCATGCTVGKGKGQGRGNGNGKCNGSGRTKGGRGSNYVDANKNGVCDHRENANNNK